MDESSRFKPGMLVWARMPGFPLWPSIICEEDRTTRMSAHKIKVFFLGVHVFYRVVKSELIENSPEFLESARQKVRNDASWHIALQEAGDSVLQVKLWKEYEEKFENEKKSKKVKKNKNLKKKTKKTNIKLKEKIEMKKLICKIAVQPGLRIPTLSPADSSHIDAGVSSHSDSQSSFDNDVTAPSDNAASFFGSNVVSNLSNNGASSSLINISEIEAAGSSREELAGSSHLEFAGSSNDEPRSLSHEDLADSSYEEFAGSFNDEPGSLSHEELAGSSNDEPESLSNEELAGSSYMELASSYMEPAGPSTMEPKELSDSQVSDSSSGPISLESANGSTLPVYKRVYHSLLNVGKASLGYIPPGVVTRCNELQSSVNSLRQSFSLYSLPRKGKQMLIKYMDKVRGN